MTAWQQIQQDWSMQTENKMVTGVLMWDLTAAFDTLDHEIMLFLCTNVHNTPNAFLTMYIIINIHASYISP